MKPPTQNFSAAARMTGRIGVVALFAAALVGWRFPEAFAPAWRCAVFMCLGPALGSLVFVLIHQLTGGEWGRALRPYLLGGVRLLPWMWLLLLPLLVSAMLAPSPLEWWRYGAPMAFALRAVGYGTVFWFLSHAVARAWPRGEPVERLAWVGPAGLIAVLFMTHLLATDWLAALDPHWISTAFPVVWLIGQAVAGLALAVIVGTWAGADPARSLGNKRTLGIDWGTLLFATAMLWCYVAFAQFLIVWSGNIPVEAAWYARRLEGAWRFLPLVLLVLHFIAPLIVLLSRRAKQNRRALVTVAALLLGAQTLQTAWMILPAFPQAPGALPWLALILALALGGLFANRYLAFAGKEEAAS
jgi:hypothetical protein